MVSVSLAVSLSSLLAAARRNSESTSGICDRIARVTITLYHTVQREIFVGLNFSYQAQPTVCGYYSNAQIFSWVNFPF